jgi:hypothetical protein
VPLALHVLSGDAGERVVYGDSRGAAVLLLCGSRELPPRDLISTETHKVRAVHLLLKAGAAAACPIQEGTDSSSTAGAQSCRQGVCLLDFAAA